MKRAVRIIGALVTVGLCACLVGANVPVRALIATVPSGQDVAQVAASTDAYIDAAAALQASQANLAAMGVVRLRSETGASGLGQVIAVVDTGVDPRVFGGANWAAPQRVVDWIDLTGEGISTPVGQYTAESGVIHVGEIPLNVGSLRSRSGKYLVGVLPSALTSGLGGYRQVYFVVSDPDSAGMYNTVTVDTDSDLDLSNEVSLREFRSNRSYAVLRISDERSVALAASRIDATTGTVSFGFDLNGHGTGIAALAAGSGALPGVAPEARVVVIKALGSDGLGDWFDIERGIEEAIAAKANIVLVGSARQQSGEDPEWEQIQSKMASMLSHLVLPAGNAGPGAGTITVSTESDATVLVSGYLPQVSAKSLLGIGLTADAWYPISSCGPGPEGNRGPNFMAPAVAAVPAFRADGEPAFTLMEGTSVSAAYAAGALALVRQTQSGPNGTLAKALGFVTDALSQGASKLPGVLPVEQGSGRLDVSTAWDILRSRPDHRRLLIAGKWGSSPGTEGMWVEGTTPGAFPAWIDNYAPVARQVVLSTGEPWLRPRSDTILMEPVSQRETVIYGSGELMPGFYSQEITADDPTTKGADSCFTVTVAVPHRFDALGRSSFDMGAGSGGAARQFVRVPASAESLSLTISGAAQGERYAIYSPDGVLVRQGALDGAVTTRIGLPAEGPWQVCVFGVSGTERSTPAKVQASLEGFFASDLGATLDSEYYLIRTPGNTAKLRTGAADHVSEWRHRSSFSQATGRSTQLMLPDLAKQADVLSVRFGTSTGSALRVYLMYFDTVTARWSEVGRAITASTGVGEIHLPNPPLGKYAVHIESYGSGSQVYVELDVNVLVSGGQGALSGALPTSITQGSTTLRIPLRTDPGEPKYIVLLRQSDSKIMGVLERPLVSTDELPVVQISGGPDLRTIRAWQRQGMKPVDALVTVGGMSYQLSGGRITAPVPGGMYPSLRTEEGSRIVFGP